MKGEPLQKNVVVTLEQGFHLRPQQAFSALARKFESDVSFYKGGEKFDGKSPLSLMGMAAVQGTELILEISGPDQEAARVELLELWDNLSNYSSESSEITGN